MADIIARLFSLGSKLQDLPEDKEKAISGYGFYDWGKSAFETSVTVALLPAWYAFLFLEANGLTATLGSITMTGDAIWSLSVAIATLIVAVVSPPFGVIADRRLIKIKWLKIMTYIGAGATFLLAFAPFFGNASWIWLMVMFLLANIGLNGAGVFYNSLLPHLGKEDEMDDISNRAFAYGYLGGGILLLIHMGLFLTLGASIIPFCMATAGVWWYGFALLTFMWVPEPPIENEMEAMKFRKAAKFAVSEVTQTLRDIKKFPNLFLYMLAYFFFIDGINTITALGGVFGTTVLGVTTTELIITILAIQFVAAPSAVAFTNFANRVGTKRALTVSIVGWVVLCFAALAFVPLELEEHDEFFILYEWNESDEVYDVHVDYYTPEIAQKLDYGDKEFNEQAWAEEWKDFLPLEYSAKTQTQSWNYGETVDDEWVNFTKNMSGITNSEIESFLISIDDTRFSVSILGGALDGVNNVGIDHPSDLGDGSIDFIPAWARDNIWEPFGLTVFLQFLLLGTMMGTLLGGSQGLSRSIFGQIIPETRSTEFFGFFGFFGKVAAFMGPTLYFFMAVMYDSRMGIFSIAVLLLIGLILLYMVDIDAGRLDAQAEDKRLRAIKASLKEDLIDE
ncbi:MFS transporter [Euryarchaeota archaeon]|jgi:UMF1 family MFS transporter|nr:MFS transporter [Euryarchaeota archaeon]